MYRLYCLRNEINEIVYVGMTSKELKDRFNGHKKEHKHRKKYSIELMATFEEKKVASINEERSIILLDTVKNGENITYGQGRKGLGSNETSFKKGNKLGEIPSFYVICNETGDIGTVKELCEKLTLTKSKVYEVCKGKRKSHKGYTFSYYQILRESYK